tara:strand:- start:84 stop:497 length:414 start_codon:yes stop_codon:yes gene_type:complete
MAKADLQSLLQINRQQADQLLAGRREDAFKLFDKWKIENFGTTDVNVIPPREAMPQWTWPYLNIPRASRDELMIAHGSHDPSFTINGIPRFTDPGSHDPREHNPPVDPSGNFIEELRPSDEDIPLSSNLKIKRNRRG